MIRRLKKDVLHELPPKKRQKVEIQTESKIIAQIKVLLNKTTKKDLESDKFMKQLHEAEEENQIQEISPDDTMSCFTKAYALSGIAKLKGIKEYVSYLVESKHLS